jgi:hypothetical protein
LFRSRRAAVAAAAVILCAAAAIAQKIAWSAREKPVADQIGGLRQLPDDERARVTKELALQIRQLPAETKKLPLAAMLANLATEGDLGHDTLQEVATTLAEALRQRPGGPAAPYVELAQLVRYEHVEAALDDPSLPPPSPNWRPTTSAASRPILRWPIFRASSTPPKTCAAKWCW